MALKPAVKALLETIKASGAKPIYEQDVLEARAQREEVARQMQKDLRPVYEVREIYIAGKGGPLTLRMYRPNRDERLPALVYFHGGGFVVGSVETVDDTCRALANYAQIAVVSVDYRLAPEHPYPAAIDDAYDATRWVAQNGHRLGFDPARIAVGGDSAGGNLAAATAIRARDRGEFSIGYQMLIYPMIEPERFDSPSYCEYADNVNLTRDALIWFWDQYAPKGTARKLPDLCPREASAEGLAPAFVLVAECDPLRSEGEAYAEHLRAAGVAVSFQCVSGLIHGYFSTDWGLPEREEALHAAADSLRQALHAAQ